MGEGLGISNEEDQGGGEVGVSRREVMTKRGRKLVVKIEMEEAE